ncbi:hypothetical protein HPB50_017583 [Hyalomma asiaticum]|uniref:Uncharacterized protein n=1 Tax=Hyalomma asiaticum TaxID=266040 RepID=A0ACB7STK7_HYAAI|nr:hypothetical protein HPB50_017583 [Hyalomma asiaticum]
MRAYYSLAMVSVTLAEVRANAEGDNRLACLKQEQPLVSPFQGEQQQIGPGVARGAIRLNTWLRQWRAIVDERGGGPARRIGDDVRRPAAQLIGAKRRCRSNLAGGIVIAEEYRRRTTGEEGAAQPARRAKMAPRARRLRRRRAARRRDFTAEATRGFGPRPLRQPLSAPSQQDTRQDSTAGHRRQHGPTSAIRRRTRTARSMRGVWLHRERRVAEQLGREPHNLPRTCRPAAQVSLTITACANVSGLLASSLHLGRETRTAVSTRPRAVIYRDAALEELRGDPVHRPTLARA